MKKRKKRLKMSKFERFLYVLTFLLIISTPVCIIFSKATLSKINYEVEKTKKEIKAQEKKNESLQMKIDELTSFEKIQEIAKELGLSYNSDRYKSLIEGSGQKDEEKNEE